MNERGLTAKVKRYLKDRDGWYLKVHGGIYQAGIPDIIGSLKGRFISVELKKDKTGKLTKLQEQTIKKIIERGGGISFVAYGWEDFKQKFDSIYNKIMKGEL